jgi:hypothetical protein
MVYMDMDYADSGRVDGDDPSDRWVPALPEAPSMTAQQREDYAWHADMIRDEGVAAHG